MTYEEYANVQLDESNIPCVLGVGSQTWGVGWIYKQLYNPYIQSNNQTLEGISSLTPSLLFSSTKSIGYYYPRPQITMNYVFSDITVGTETYLSRFSTEDLTEIKYRPETETNRAFYLFTAYDDNIVYTLEQTYDDLYTYNYMQLCKVTFTEGGSTSREICAQWNYYETISSIDYNFWDAFIFSRVKYGNTDTIVHLSSFIGDEPQSYLFKSVIYHIDTGLYDEQWTIPTTDMDGELNTSYWECASPSFYQDKIIWTYTIKPPSGMSGPPYGSHSLFASLVIDATTDTLTRVDNYKWNLDTDWTFVTTYQSTGMIDYSTGKYYFTYYQEPDSNPALATYRIASIDLTTSYSITDIDDFTMYDMYTGWQSMNKPYVINSFYTPTTVNIYEVPSFTTSNSMNVQFDLCYCACIVDTKENILWNMTSASLVGKYINGGSTNRDITIAWSGGSIPFSYPLSREVDIQIFNKKALIFIYSRRTSPTAYQTALYLLK